MFTRFITRLLQLRIPRRCPLISLSEPRTVTVYISNSAGAPGLSTFAIIISLFACSILAKAQPQTISLAVLDLGPGATGAHAANALRQVFRENDESAKQFDLIDKDLATAAARGSGFQGIA